MRGGGGGRTRLGIVRTGMTGGAPCWDGELGDMGGTWTPWGQDDRGHVGIVGTGRWGAHGWTSCGQGHTDIVGTKLRGTHRGTSWGQGHGGWGHVGHMEQLGDRTALTRGCLGDRDTHGHCGDKAVGHMDTLGTGARGTHGWTSWGQGHVGHVGNLGTKLWDTRTASWDGATWDMRMGILGTRQSGTHRGHGGDRDTASAAGGTGSHEIPWGAWGPHSAETPKGREGDGFYGVKSPRGNGVGPHGSRTPKDIWGRWGGS